VPRYVRASIVPDEEGTWKRVRENDLVNGREIVDPRKTWMSLFLVGKMRTSSDIYVCLMLVYPEVRIAESILLQ
jgi:hypothetical protein